MDSPSGDAALMRADASHRFAEEYVAEDPLLADARARAATLGCVPVGPGSGAALRLLAALLGARAVVEIGTGAGVSGLWLLRGMSPDGILTSVDIEAEHQRNAREIFAAEGVAPSRLRLITGRALDVLPRLADSAYDLIFVDATPADHPHYVREGVRLLRPGGVLVLHNALLGGRVADPAERDATVLSVRDAARAVSADDRLAPVVLPLGDGLLCAVRIS